MKTLISGAIAALFAVALMAPTQARELQLGNIGDVENEQNWRALSEHLLGETAAFPAAGVWNRNRVLNAGNASSYASHVFFSVFDDFVQQTLTEADGPWIENSGNDAQAADPAIAAEENGIVTLTTGNEDGDGSNGDVSVAANGSQIVMHIPVQADSGNLTFETRLHIDTAVTQTQLMVGLTDATSLELPFEIGANDTATVTATDAVMFVYDTNADTDQWFAMGVDSGTQASSTGTTSATPAADTHQRLTITLTGRTARFYVDGTLKKTLRSAVTANTNLYATVIANSLTDASYSTPSRTIDIDYIFVGQDRT